MARPNTGPRLAVSKSGYYEIRWTEQGRSRRKSTMTKDIDRAQGVLAQHLQRQPGAKMETLHEVLGHYVAVRGPSIKDQRSLSISSRYLDQHFGALKVTELEYQHSIDYAAKRASGELGARAGKPGTVRRELGVLIAALRFAAKDGKLPSGRVPPVPRPNAPKSKEKWLTREQVASLVEYLQESEVDDAGRPNGIHLFTVLALATAARKSAIEALKVKHMERGEAHWTVRYDLTSDTQTTKRRVAVPVNDFLEGYLPFMLDGDPDDPVLGSHGKVDSAFEWMVRRAATATGCARLAEITPHWLRHTCATQMLRRGASPWAVAGVLGDTLETVTTTYGHHIPEHKKEAADNWL